MTDALQPPVMVAYDRAGTMVDFGCRAAVWYPIAARLRASVRP